MEQHKEKFTTDFNENKKMLGQLAVVRSKGLKNEVAGYITKYLKSHAETKSRVEEEEDLEEEVETTTEMGAENEESAEQDVLQEPAQENQESEPQEIVMENKDQESS